MKRVVFIVISFIFLNIIIQFLFFLKDTFVDENQIFRKYGKEFTLKAYPNQRENIVDEILSSTWGREMTYDSEFFFKEKEFQSKHVNIDVNGIRSNGPEIEWPIKKDNINIFVFGGSTTFGYGQSDENTIPSFLERKFQKENKDIKVYNFGAGFYYSTQEKLKFHSLIKNGFKPDYAIFIDGLNEFYFDEKDLIKAKAELEPNWKNHFISFSKGMPIGRLIFSIYALTNEKESKIYGDSFKGECVKRYLNNKTEITKICIQHNIPPLFVIQPVPYYSYNLSHHLFIDIDIVNMIVKNGYSLLNKELNVNDLWLGDIQKDDTSNNYVDEVHYTKKMNERIAIAIANRIKLE